MTRKNERPRKLERGGTRKNRKRKESRRKERGNDARKREDDIRGG